MMTTPTSLHDRADTAALHYLENAGKTREVPAGQFFAALTCLGLACAFPLAAEALDQGFYIGFATRIMIYVIAVTSLNLLVGYAGLISFGHAARSLASALMPSAP